MSGLLRLFHELRRRRVFRAAGVYVVGAWVVLQVADLALAGLGIAQEAIRYVWIAAFVGLPIALVFAWRFQITPHGIVRTAPGDDSASAGPLRASDYSVLATLALITGLVLVQLTAQVRDVAPGGASMSRSVAVLPLANITGDPDQEYFVAGVHDALITMLSRIGAIRVISSRSASVYRNVVQPIRQTATELGVGFVVEGSVFRAGDRVRINVQLIDAATDTNVWSELYERGIEDILGLQGEVARAVAQQVQVELTPDEERRLTTTRPVNPVAYEAYLRGMFHLNQYTPEGMQRGMSYLQDAVDADPDEPLAHAGLALGYTLMGHSAIPPLGVWEKAHEAAARALDLDPSFAEAHAAMAEIHLYHSWDWEAAEQEFQRAIEINPNLDFAHAHYAWYLLLGSDTAGAVDHMKRAQQIAPVTPIITAWLGWIYLGLERYDEAIAESRRALELNADFLWGLYVMGCAYREKGMLGEAIATHEVLLESRPNVARWGLVEDYVAAGREADARRVLAELEENPGQKDLLYLAVGYARLGEIDRAIEWLETAYEARVDWLPWFVSELPQPWRTAELEANPRFQSLVAKMDLPD